MSFYNYLSENIILPFADLITRQSVSNHIKFLLKSQYWSREQLDDYQNMRLRLLIRHAYNSVPYYNDLFNKLNLSIDDIQSKSDLVKLPILTKSIIKQEGLKRFESVTIKEKNKVKESSSGSTGEPLVYLTTKEAYSFNIACEIRGWYWGGYRLGDRYIKLSQNPRKKLIKILQDKISNNKYIASNPLIDENFSLILNKINKFRPVVIRSYPDPFVFLANYNKKNNILVHKPQLIVTTGNTLLHNDRLLIEEEFNCKIFDTYNCEGNPNVFECPTHSGYHSSEEYGISEVIDNSGKIISNGVGKLISTDLWNYAHPFIRYDTQDLIELDNSKCQCNRRHLRIKKIMGRENDIIETPKNKFIVHNFTIFFSRQDLPTFGKIEKFQVRKKNKYVLFILVVNKSYNASIERFIIDYWEKEMGITVQIKLLDDIPLTQSGKHKFIINDERNNY